MKIERIVYKECIHKKWFPIGTIILSLDNGNKIACYNFHSIKGKLEIFTYKPFGKWKREFARNEYTKIIYDCHRKENRRNNNIDYEKLMKHDRVHKKGGGGKISPSCTITDYECTNNPMHDFRRSMYIQWN